MSNGNQSKIMLGMLLMLSGCSSTEAIYRNYDRLVDSRNGVMAQEAKIIAQKELVGMQQRRDYRVSVPDLKDTLETRKYPDYWFVSFGHNWFSPISTDPLAKTYTELKEAQYIVVIDKKTGEIKFSGEWYPKRANNFDWVFDPKGYLKDSSLSLPPYEKGRKFIY